MALDDTAIDGVVPLKTVRAAFDELEALCRGPQSHEAKDLLVPTLKRFQTLREEYKAWELSGSRRVEVGAFVGVLKRFLLKLSNHATLTLADRVVDYKYLLSTLDSIHSGRDSLDDAEQRLKGNDEGRREPWEGETAFDAAKKAYPKALETAMDAFIAAAEADLMINQLRLAEAEVVFRVAKESKDELKLNDLVVKYTPEIEKLAREAKVPALDASLPEWFIPRDKVQYDEKVVAKGSFGTIHSGTWGSGTKVVIKKLLVKRRNDVLVKERFSLEHQREFTREADRWAKLKHPYVCQLWGACHVSEPPLMVCESALKNGNLHDYIRTPTGEQRFWRLLYHMALGIEYLHDKRLIHGDLKLNNVLVGDDGYSRVTDFGLSRFKRSTNTFDSSVEGEAQSVGALRWRAPECVEGKQKPKMESDIYSLGMCIYEAFARDAPYGATPDLGVTERIKKGDLPEQPANCPDDAWALIKKLTQLNPADRPKIAAVTKEMYEKFVAEEEKKDYVGIFVCVICGTEVPEHAGNKCRKCLKVVEVRQKDGTEPFTIKNKDDLPRVVEMLSTKSDAQRMSATSALKTYVFGDPTHQKEVSEARAMAVLAKIVRTETEPVEIQRECQVTLGCIAVGNNVGQKDANYEDVIPRLIAVLNSGPDRLKNKSAMVLGYLSYGNNTNREEILTGANVIAKITEMQNHGSEEERRAAKKALAILQTPTQDLPTARAA